MSDAALSTKLSLLFIFLGFIVHIIGFGAPYWQVTAIHHEGLWQVCEKVFDTCSEIDVDNIKIGGEYNIFYLFRHIP